MSQWFYIRQWKAAAKERLKAHRTIHVSWNTLDTQEKELPKFVKLPEEVPLTNDTIFNYLLTEYKSKAVDWSVPQRGPNETRV